MAGCTDFGYSFSVQNLFIRFAFAGLEHVVEGNIFPASLAPEVGRQLSQKGKVRERDVGRKAGGNLMVPTLSHFAQDTACSTW